MTNPLRRSLLRAACSSLFLTATVGLTACDPGYGVQGTVHHADALLGGHVLVVTVYPQAQLGKDGYPLANEDSPPTIALAKRVDGGESSFQWSKLGCDPDVRVVAWIDLDDSEGFEEKLVPGRVLSDADESTDLHELMAAARPHAGDWQAVSAALDFSGGIGPCAAGPGPITLDPAPAPSP
jgi:hypothetical protein